MDGNLKWYIYFQDNNNFDAVRTSLMGITEEGEQFLSSIKMDGTPALEEPENNETTAETPIFGSYVKADEDEYSLPVRIKNLII